MDLLLYKSDKELFLILTSSQILSENKSVATINKNQRIKLSIIEIEPQSEFSFKLKFTFMVRTKESNLVETLQF